MTQSFPSQPRSEENLVSEADKHLAGLHKMSTTAGVTNRDYVSVNVLAIIAALLGLASGLAFLGLVMLVLPVGGLICALVAMHQIRSSSGTQTGRGLALTGLILSLLCGGGTVALAVTRASTVRSETAGIATTLSEVGGLIKQGKFSQAYALFDGSFKEKVSLDQFQRTLEMLQAPTALGKLESMEWNGITPYFQSVAGARAAQVKARVKFARVDEERYDVWLRRVGSRWLVQSIPTMIPERSQPPASRPAAPGAAG